MFKYVVLVTALAGSVWGAPQSISDSLGTGGRIVGGQDTTIEAHPYIVSVLRNGNHWCGGSILSATWVVSAAHCINFTDTYSIRTGSTVRDTGGQVIAAADIIIHPLYLRATLDYDIVLIRLASSITISVARAILLAAEGSAIEAGVTSTITGWGSLLEGGVSATTLQVVQVPIISQANCRASYGQSVITDRMFCAGLLGVGGRDACQGDSGGPLIANGVLTGIVSWGAGCARPNSPGVYASVPALRAWIRENSGI